jgi:hypothetical protein
MLAWFRWTCVCMFRRGSRSAQCWPRSNPVALGPARDRLKTWASEMIVMFDEKDQVNVATRSASSNPVWHRAAASFAIAHGWDIAKEALNRLENGDLASTPHGIRVRMRGDLGDDPPESGGMAFWPTWKEREFWPEPMCACHQMRRDGICSHVIAASIYEDWLDKRANGGT